MVDQSRSPTPDGVLVSAPSEWQAILQASNQVVLYNPTSHALSIRRSPGALQQPTGLPGWCPYCHQSLPRRAGRDPVVGAEDEDEFGDWDQVVRTSSRAPNYFQLLEVANETSSRPSTPPLTPRSEDGEGSDEDDGAGAFSKESMAQGYFKAFFKEECRLGMGANGSVFLCQVSILSSHDGVRDLTSFFCIL
jgi:hypothetical protein